MTYSEASSPFSWAQAEQKQLGLTQLSVIRNDSR